MADGRRPRKPPVTLQRRPCKNRMSDGGENGSVGDRLRDYRYDHVHLRSPDPDATARFFETMFGAEVTRSVYPPGTLYPGQQRITMRLGGQIVLIAPSHPHEPTATAPPFPHYGSEHIGLTADDVDAARGGIARQRYRDRHRPVDP